jgi:ribosomal protein S14
MRYKKLNLYHKQYYYSNQELIKIKLLSLHYFFLQKKIDYLLLTKYYYSTYLKNKIMKRSPCLVSGRYRGLNTLLGVSRIELRNIASTRAMPGLKKMS